jgi:hypothetical protein
MRRREERKGKERKGEQEKEKGRGEEEKRIQEEDALQGIYILYVFMLKAESRHFFSVTGLKILMTEYR